MSVGVSGSGCVVDGKVHRAKALRARTLRGEMLRGVVLTGAILPLAAPAWAQGATQDIALQPVAVSAAPVTGRSPVAGFVAGVSATGTKTDTPLIETPQALTVITRDRMETQNARSVTDAVRYTAGVNADSYGADVRGFYGSIRAFTPDIFLDGTRLPITVPAQSFQLEPWGLERIDVIRGASSPLYGSGNLGGIINGVSKTPQAGQRNEVQVQGGSYGRIQGAVDVGGALNQDGTLLYRFNGLMRDSGTSYDNIKNNRIYAAPSVTWRPDSRTSVTLLGSYMQDDAGSTAQFLPASGTLLPNARVHIPRDFLNGDKNFDVYSKRQIGLGYIIEHKPTENWTLRQVMRFTHVDLNYRSIYGTGLAAGSSVLLNRAAAAQQPNLNTVTLDNQSEVKFATGPVAHTVLTGIDFRNNFLANRTSTVLGPQLNLANPVYLPVAYPSFTAVSAISTNQVQRQVGLYAQDQLSVDRWRLTLTGRQDFAQTDTYTNTTRLRTVADDTKFTGRAALLYASAIGASPYVSYATSFLPVAGTNLFGQTYVPQTGKQMEVGIKYQPPSGNILLGLAAYDLRQQNVLTVDPANSLNSIQTGEVRSRGVEFEVLGKLTDRLSVIGTLTYQEPEVTKTTVAAQLGKRPVAQPSHMASVWMDYVQSVSDDITLGLGGGVRYTGMTAGDTTNTFNVPSFALLDLQARADYKAWRLQVNATNLTDKTYVAACSSLAGCSYGTGRAVYATLGYRW